MTITLTREEAQQVLDAFELLQTDIEWQFKSPTRAMLRKIEKTFRARLAQPERKWQGLTDEEASQIWDGHIVPVFGKNGINPIVFARAIEAKLKAKNGF